MDFMTIKRGTGNSFDASPFFLPNSSGLSMFYCIWSENTVTERHSQYARGLERALRPLAEPAVRRAREKNRDRAACARVTE